MGKLFELETTKMLIIHYNQFGYHTGNYYAAKNLSKQKNVSFICWDYGYKRIELNNVKVTYVSRQGGKFARLFRLILTSIKNIRKNKHSAVLIVYFPLCCFVKLFCKQTLMILDFRTGDVSGNKFYVYLKDSLCLLESFFFKHITVISESLIKRLHLPKRKCHVLPLGATKIVDKEKKIDKLELLYIGTFHNRNINYTIEGFTHFLKEFGSVTEANYHIVGFGSKQDEEEIRYLIKKHGRNEKIQFHGRIHGEEIKPFFEKCNIGVSFIPITDYYNCQPPTKTFEYLANGMTVIATATDENKKIINESNGVLIEDTTEDFYKGLKKLYHDRTSYNSKKIMDNLSYFSWENIWLKNFLPYLEKLIEKNK